MNIPYLGVPWALLKRSGVRILQWKCDKNLRDNSIAPLKGSDVQTKIQSEPRRLGKPGADKGDLKNKKGPKPVLERVVLL